MNIKYKIFYSACIFFVSVFLILLWGSFKAEAFLIDDNRNQWFPVIEKTYEHLFEYGTIPGYNFYLFKGLPIADPGYYGLFNPIMLVSYILSHYTPLPFSTLTIHISILFGLGNVFMFALCHKLGGSVRLSLLTVAAYSACSAFLSFHYWYYVFNNYAFIPLLFYTMLQFDDTKLQYCACGIILAFEILMGNAQYTCYHYIAYCIVCVVLILFKPKYIKVMLSNIAVGLGLSIPFFVMLLNASSGGFEGKNLFLSQRIDNVTLLINSVIPGGMLMDAGIELYLPNNAVMDRTDRTLFYTAPVFIPILICVISWVITVLKNDKSSKVTGLRQTFVMLWDSIKEFHRSYKTKPMNVMILIPFVVVVLFFSDFATQGIVALILSKVPVIKNFRFLFKAVFVMVPFLAITMGLLISRSAPKAKKIACIVCAVFTFIGMINNYYVIEMFSDTEVFGNKDNITVSEEKSYSEDLIDKYDLDLKNYRSLTFYQSEMITREKFNYHHTITRNFPAYVECFSVLAYEISGDVERLSDMDMLFSTKTDHSLFSNAGILKYFLSNLKDHHAETIKQISENSIKYLFLEKPTDINRGEEELRENKDYLTEVINELNSSDLIDIDRIEDVGESYVLVVLADVTSLCKSSDRDFIPLTDERMELLTFEPDDSDEYTLAFGYDEHIIAYQLNESGQKMDLSVSENDYGNIIVNGVHPDRGKVFIGYHNPTVTIGVIFETIITVLFVFVMILFLIPKDKYKVKDKKTVR